VRKEILEAGAVREYDYAGQRPLRLLILGGSLGAAPINEIVPGAVRRLARDWPGRIEVWHQTGEAHFQEMSVRYEGISKEVIKYSSFIEDMKEAYKWSDIVLCRSGALTVSELAIMGRPAILVPLPGAIDDHQRLNAQTLARAGAAEILLQTEFDSYRLGIMFRNYLTHPEILQAMSVAAYKVGNPYATQKISDYCEDLCRGR
jgi:UDP-N-acetylglucosamine--N-acetylmuramyl-(pentapeptide) pyrophosphoryl-undecaprenol N-acetylglucosamine transferase